MAKLLTTKLFSIVFLILIGFHPSLQSAEKPHCLGAVNDVVHGRNWSSTPTELKVALKNIKSHNEALEDERLVTLFAQKLDAEEQAHPQMAKRNQVASFERRVELFKETWQEAGHKAEDFPLVLSEEKVTVMQKSGDGFKPQSIPLRKVFFPKIQTGAFFPTKGVSQPGMTVSPKKPDGILIILPGMGTDKSNALSLMPIISRFAKQKHKVHIVDEASGQKAYTLAIGLDTTGAGMALNAPKYLTSPNYSSEAVRHTYLIMKILFPETRISLAGRSQGALQSLEYSSRYTGLHRVFPMNPSSIDPKLHQHALMRLERDGKIEGFQVIQKNIDALNEQILEFEYRLKKPQNRTIILLGEQDAEYGHPVENPENYASYHKSWDDFSRQHTEVDLWKAPNGKHNMWDTLNDKPLFDEIIQFMNREMYL
ncbi:MAG: hypothetical protein ACPGJV_06110 [Bacteriovoracaceae bacterium]